MLKAPFLGEWAGSRVEFFFSAGKMARTHGHRTDSACCRRTPSFHRLRTASVRLHTVSVCIGTASTTGFPLSKRSQYRLKRFTNGLKRYANGARTASVYSRLSPSYARVYGPFSFREVRYNNSYNYYIKHRDDSRHISWELETVGF